MKNSEAKFRTALASAVRNNRTNNTAVILNMLSGVRRVNRVSEGR